MNNSNNKKKWHKFKLSYTFLILALLIYILRPLKINKNNSANELSLITSILAKSLTKDNYESQLNNIISQICDTYIKINSANIESIKSKEKISEKILNIIKKLLNVDSYVDFYNKLIMYEPETKDNKDFFKYIVSLINFEGRLNSNKQLKEIAFLVKRGDTSGPLNIKISSNNNSNINDQLKVYKNYLLNISKGFFKNFAKNNNIQFINSKVSLKSSNNIGSIPTNSNLSTNSVKLPNNSAKLSNNSAKLSNNSAKLSNNSAKLSNNSAKLSNNSAKLSNNSVKLPNNISGGGNNKSKSKSKVKNMWWLKKYM